MKMKILPNPPSDCLVCALSLNLIMGSICGVSAVSFKCPHSRHKPSPSNFFQSKLRLVLSSIFILPIIVNIFLRVYDLVYGFDTTERTVLFKLMEIVVNTGSLGFAIPGIWKYKQRLTALNGLNLIIKSRQYYGFPTLLTKKAVMASTRTCYINILVIAVTGIPLIIYASAGRPHFISVPDFILRSFTLIMNNYIQWVSSFQHLLEALLYRSLFKRCFEQIENIMKKHLIRLELEEIREVDEIPLEENLKRLKSLYTSLTLNYQEFNKLVFPAILVWILMMVTVQILNFFQLVLYYSNRSDGDIVTIMGAHVGTIGIIAYFSILETINVVVSIICKFCFS